MLGDLQGTVQIMSKKIGIYKFTLFRKLLTFSGGGALSRPPYHPSEDAGKQCRHFRVRERSSGPRTIGTYRQDHPCAPAAVPDTAGAIGRFDYERQSGDFRGAGAKKLKRRHRSLQQKYHIYVNIAM